MRKPHIHITTLAFALLLLLLTGCQGLLAPPEVLPTRVILPSQTPSPAPTFTPWPPFRTIAPAPSATYPPTPTRAPTGTPLPAGTPTAIPPLGVMNFPPDVNPLTGLKVANPAILNRRPVMVKVSNFPRTGRPHAGLSAADIVFEYYIGEFENRFLAVYYGQDSNWIGPLRSGRLVDAQLTDQYGGILVYGNADTRVDKVLVDRLGTRAITFDDAPCPPICGKETHSIEGVFVNSGATTQFAIAQKIDNTRPDLTGMLFDARPPASQTVGEFLGVMFGPENRGEWHYDASRGLYMRWIEEQRSGNVFVQVPLVDRNTYKQLGFENVIVLFTQYTELLPTMFEMEVAGNIHQQRAVFFRDGKMTDGLWRSNGADRPLSLMSSWGISYILKPGRTWMILVGLSSDLTQDSLGQWELEYHTR